MEYLQENWENLANAIIIRAVKDYANAYRHFLRHPKNKAAQKEVKKLEQFFFSDWYAALTDVDPNYLLNRLKEGIETGKLELPG